jgi:hypothetical protein
MFSRVSLGLCGQRRHLTLAKTRRKHAPVRGVWLKTVRQVEAGVGVINRIAHSAASFAAGGRAVHEYSQLGDWLQRSDRHSSTAVKGGGKQFGRNRVALKRLGT